MKRYCKLPEVDGQENKSSRPLAGLTGPQISSLISSAELWQLFSGRVNSAFSAVFSQVP